MAKNFDGLTQGSFTATVEGPGGSPVALAEDIRGGGMVVVQNDSDRDASIDSKTLENRMIIWHEADSEYQYYDAHGIDRGSDGELSGGTWRALTFGTAGVVEGFGINIDNDTHAVSVDTDIIADTEFVKQYVEDHAGEAHLAASVAGYGILYDTDSEILSVDTDVIADVNYVDDAIANVRSQEIFWRNVDAHQKIVSLDNDTELVDIHVADSEYTPEIIIANYDIPADQNAFEIVVDEANATFPVTAGTTLIFNTPDNDYELDTTTIPTAQSFSEGTQTLWQFSLSQITILRGPTPTNTQINTVHNGRLKSVHNKTEVAVLAKQDYVDNHAGVINDDTAGYGINIDTEGTKNVLSVDTEVITTLSDVFGEFNNVIYRGRVELGGGKGQGAKARAEGNNAVAIGVASIVTHNSSTALGTAAVADTDNQVMLGGSSIVSIKVGAKITPTDSEELVQKHYVDGLIEGADDLVNIADATVKEISDSETAPDWTLTGGDVDDQWEFKVAGTVLNPNVKNIDFRTVDLDPGIVTADFIGVYQEGSPSTESWYRITQINEVPGDITRVHVLYPELTGDTDYLQTLQDSNVAITNVKFFATIKDANWGLKNIDTDVIADTEWVKQYVEDHAGEAHLAASVAGFGILYDTDSEILSVDTDVIADTEWVTDNFLSDPGYLELGNAEGVPYNTIADTDTDFAAVGDLADIKCTDQRIREDTDEHHIGVSTT